jgi:hypothetical protein
VLADVVGVEMSLGSVATPRDQHDEDDPHRATRTMRTMAPVATRTTRTPPPRATKTTRTPPPRATKTMRVGRPRMGHPHRLRQAEPARPRLRQQRRDRSRQARWDGLLRNQAMNGVLVLTVDHTSAISLVMMDQSESTTHKPANSKRRRILPT